MKTNKEILKVLKDARILILRMGTVIRNNDEEGKNIDLWANDGDFSGNYYVPDDAFDQLEFAIKELSA